MKKIKSAESSESIKDIGQRNTAPFVQLLHKKSEYTQEDYRKEKVLKIAQKKKDYKLKFAERTISDG